MAIASSLIGAQILEEQAAATREVWVGTVPERCRLLTELRQRAPHVCDPVALRNLGLDGIEVAHVERTIDQWLRDGGLRKAVDAGEARA